jgi:signal transduction histidine kinase
VGTKARRFPHPPGRHLVRDWRVKTLVPVVVLNIAAFAVLYFVMYHFAVSNLVKTRQFGAEIIAGELEIDLPELMSDGTGAKLKERLAAESKRHSLLALNVFDSKGDAVISAGRRPRKEDLRAARDTINRAGPDMDWGMEEGDRFLVIGTRPLDNSAACHGCHEKSASRLGAMQMTIDLTEPMAAAAERVRSRFALAGAAWAAMLGIMFWTGGVVIGRPLKQIRRTIAADADGGEQDLDSLANRLNETLWEMLQKQRTREDDLKRHMVRAEQLAALGELAAGLTHEIKNPLAGVISATEMIRDQAEPGSEEREISNQMLAELRRVTTTVDSLLRLARPQQPQRVETDLRRIARDLVTLFAPRAKRQGVTLEIETAESTPQLLLDPGLMTQVLINLITNAIQATPRGGSVRVIVAPFPRHDGLVMAVADTGRGIAAEDLERVFDPFYTTKEEGTGLGLAICRQIVEQHQGTMGIESEPGKGTRVVVLLPRIGEEREERDGAAAVN